MAKDADQKAEAARVASEALFAASPLPDIGKEIWRALWDAARRYSNEVAYPERKFPQAIAGDDLCVLCQQPLSQEAVDRQSTFESFIQGTTKADEVKATNALQRFYGDATKAALASLARQDVTTFFAADLDDLNLSAQIRRTATISAWRLRALIAGKAAPMPAFAFADGDCAAIDTRLSQRISQLSSDQKSPEWLALLKEHRELKDRQALSSLIEDIKAEVTRRSEIAKLETAAKDANKRPITNKNKELSDKLVTNALRGRFAREVEKLKLSRMPVELRKVKDSNAISHFRSLSLRSRPSRSGKFSAKASIDVLHWQHFSPSWSRRDDILESFLMTQCRRSTTFTVRQLPPVSSKRPLTARLSFSRTI